MRARVARRDVVAMVLFMVAVVCSVAAAGSMFRGDLLLSIALLAVAQPSWVTSYSLVLGWLGQRPVSKELDAELAESKPTLDGYTRGVQSAFEQHEQERGRFLWSLWTIGALGAIGPVIIGYGILEGPAWLWSGATVTVLGGAGFLARTRAHLRWMKRWEDDLAQLDNRALPFRSIR